MRPPEPLPDEWIDVRLEAYLDDALSADERVRFEQGLTANADWEDELFLARQIRDGLRALPLPTLPASVTDAVLAQARRDARGSWIGQLRAWVQRHVVTLWQPALAMAVVLLLVVSAALIGRPTPRDSYAEAEVQQALADVQWALGYLSEVSRQTGKVVREDVIADHVVSPVQDVLGGRSQ